MGLENLYKEVMDLNLMADNDQKEAAAKAFFERLNHQKLPEYFNWADEIFEKLHVKERGDKTALIWADIAKEGKKSYTYKEFAARGNQCLNLLRNSGVEKGDNMYMMTPIVPETWFSTYACIKGGVINVPTATSMTMRELKFRFESYAPNVIVADESFTELMDEAIDLLNVK
ncbi:MAG: AMP-binding protein, partial [Desulfobacterium sp.]|nr:AMP-binding protein [Desulfobacterium sp.]